MQAQPVPMAQPVAQAAPAMQKMMVTVPSGCYGGQPLQVQTPAGLMQVRLPPPPPPLSIAAKLSPASPAARNCSQRIRLLQVTIPAGLQPGQQFEMLVPAPAPPPPLPVVQGSLIAKAQPAAPAYPQQGGYPAQPAGNQVVHHHVHSSGGYPQGPPGYPQGPQGYGGGGYYSGGYHQHPQQYHNGRGSGGNMALGIGGGLMGGLMLGSMMDGGLFD